MKAAHSKRTEPNVGRFLVRDPIGYAAGTNLYAYVGNNPVNLIDPSGLEAWLGNQRFQRDPNSLPSGERYQSQLLGTALLAAAATPVHRIGQAAWRLFIRKPVEATVAARLGQVRFDGSLAYTGARMEAGGAAAALDGKRPAQTPRLAASATVVSVLHDLSLALQADRIVALRDGRVAAAGAADREALHDALVEVLQQSMAAQGVPFRAQNRLLAKLAPMHRDVITVR